MSYDTAHRFLEVAFKDILTASTDRKQAELRKKCEEILSTFNPYATANTLETLQDLNKAQHRTKSDASLVPYQDAISIKTEYVQQVGLLTRIEQETR